LNFKKLEVRQTNMIRLSKSIVGPAEADAVSRVVIEDGYLGMGKEVQVFEEKLKNYLQAQHVVCVNSGTAALHLAVESCVPKGYEVLVQSLTFISSFQSITAAGAKPVPCEIVPETCTIDLKDAEKKITKKTRAIMPVHYASRVGNLDEIYDFARKYNLRVIEDAAHAFGATYNGKKLGTFGDASCFSFDPIKNISCLDGGVVLTNDDKIAELMRLKRVPRPVTMLAYPRLLSICIKRMDYRWRCSQII